LFHKYTINIGSLATHYAIRSVFKYIRSDFVDIRQGFFFIRI